MNSAHDSSVTSSGRHYLVAIIALSVLARLAAGLLLGNQVESLPGTADQVSYHVLATRVIEGHGFTFGEPWWPATQPDSPTAHWSFLYTYYLVAVYSVLGVWPLAARLIQVIAVAVLMPVLAYSLGRQVFDQRTGLIAAALTAGYAYFVYYAAALMTESFYMCAILAALYLAARIVGFWRADKNPEPGVLLRLSAGLGLALGAAILLRQVFLLFVPVLFAWMWWTAIGRRQGRQAVRVLAVAGVLIVVLILPVTAYNYSRFGEVVLLNTNAGFAFYFANHPVYGVQFEPILTGETVTYRDLLPVELKGLNEAQLDRELLKRGLAFVWADPLRYLQLSISRIPILFMFWPSNESSLLSNVARVASFGILWPFMAGGVLLSAAQLVASRGRLQQPADLLLLFSLVYVLIHVLSWTLVRYRLPVDAVLLVLAARFVSALLQLARQWRPVRAVSRNL